MRVLWLCNVMLPIIGEYLEKPFSNGGGWLTGLSQDLLESKEEDLELAVCFPIHFDEHIIRGSIGEKENYKQLQFFGFPVHTKNESIYDLRTEGYLRKIVEEYNPDIVHIFGTEFAHSLSMTRIYEDKEHMLIGMQGILSVCAKKYEADLPEKIVNRYTFRDWIKKDNIRDAKNKFSIRAKFEKEVIENAGHVAGRTKFDFEETLKINSKRKYYKLNETLREVFYQKRWEIAKMERHSIFISQGDYPLKGLHFILEALPKVIKCYPDTKLYVAGNKIVRDHTIMSFVKRSSYGKYVETIIRKNKLDDYVVFTGPLNAADMCKRFQKSNVFVSASVIENSPNSVGEAMLLGMPVVSSKVGGITDMIIDGKEGILVENSHIDEFSKAILRIFSDDEFASGLGENANRKALQTHDRVKNFYKLLEIYHEIGKNINEE